MKTEIKVAIIGAAAVIIAAVIAGLFSLGGSKTPSISQTTSGDQSPSIVAQRDVNITYQGLTKKQYDNLLKQLGQNKGVLDRLLKTLYEKDVALTDRL